MTYRIRSIEKFGKHQIILWLQDEHTKATGPREGIEWCIRLTVDEAPTVMRELAQAYTDTMQHLALDLAAGGCRTCRNTRRIVQPDQTIVPCPNCTPRAEKRIRERTMLRRKDQP